MINKLLHQELAKILQKHTQHIQALITITRITTAPDLTTAKVYVSILGKKYTQSTIKKLSTMAPRLQYELAQVVELRKIPRLRFIHDTTLDYVEHIETLLDVAD